MDGRSLRDAAVAIAACAGILLVADLGLGWHSVTILGGPSGSFESGLVVKVSATGWTNVGLFAGFVTIATLVALGRSMRPGGTVDLTQAAVTAALGVASLGFTIGAALAATSSVTVSSAGREIASRQWPAYAGIVLAAVLAATTLLALLDVMRNASVPAGPPPA